MKKLPIFPIVSRHTQAQHVWAQISKLFTFETQDAAVSFLVIGGDGFMLRSIHTYRCCQKPFYGLHSGTSGFLMNFMNQEELIQLPQRIEDSYESLSYLLQSEIKMLSGEEHVRHAVNEVSLLRATHQAVKVQLSIDGIVRMELFMGDGLMVSTPAGSTAYNFSAGGPLLPLGAPLLALTPNNPCKPRSWRGAIIPDTTVVEMSILQPTQRLASLTCDFQTFSGVQYVKIWQEKETPVKLLFDPGHHLEERILKQQFPEF